MRLTNWLVVISFFFCFINYSCNSEDNIEENAVLRIHYISAGNSTLISSGDIIQVQLGAAFDLFIESENDSINIQSSEDIEIIKVGNNTYSCFPKEIGSAYIFIDDLLDHSINGFFIFDIEIIPYSNSHVIIDNSYTIDTDNIVTKVAIKEDLNENYLFPIGSTMILSYYSISSSKSEGVIELKVSDISSYGIFTDKEDRMTFEFENMSYHFYLEEAIGFEDTGIYAWTQDLTEIYKEKFPLANIDKVTAVNLVY